MVLKVANPISMMKVVQQINKNSPSEFPAGMWLRKSNLFWRAPLLCARLFPLTRNNPPNIYDSNHTILHYKWNTIKYQTFINLLSTLFGRDTINAFMNICVVINAPSHTVKHTLLINIPFNQWPQPLKQAVTVVTETSMINQSLSHHSKQPLIRYFSHGPIKLCIPGH